MPTQPITGLTGLSGLSAMVGAAVPFDPSSLSPWLWLQAGPSWNQTDTAGTTPAADGNLVARLQDRSGNARHFTQATSGNRFTLRAEAGGKWSLEGNGSSAYYDSTYGTTQPLTIYARLYQHTASSYLFDGDNGSSRIAFGHNVAVGGDYAVYAGAAGCAAVTPVIGTTPTTFTMVANSTSSQLWKDGVSIAAGNAGAFDLANLRVGANLVPGGFFAGRVAALLFFAGVHTAQNRSDMETWLAGL